MKPFLVDVPVLILFFNRPEKLEQVFSVVKKARPSRLYLYQDGARENREDDRINVMKCREVVSAVDWDCVVKTNFQEKNQGCDPSEYNAQKWMFETEEYGIVLEDDDVPSESFFPYCKELLEKYRDDERIHMICGYNPIDSFEEVESDYFFSEVGSIWGWASWKRVIDTWDPTYQWMDDPKQVGEYVSHYHYFRAREKLIKTCQMHRDSGKAFYETINSASMMLNHRLAINPKYNMISNIGFGADTTHGAESMELLSRRTQKLFNKNVHEYQFPLTHPTEVVCNERYRRAVDAACGVTFFASIQNRISHCFRLLKYKGVSVCWGKALERFQKRGTK